MDQYHPEVQKVAERVFQEWKKRHANLENSLKTGRFVRHYAQSRSQILFDYANLQHGMYNMHDVMLSKCITTHVARWKEVREMAYNMTRAFLSEMAKRCLSMTEVVIVIFLLKTRYFAGKLNPELWAAAKGLQVPHYNPEVKWIAVFEVVSQHAQGREKARCPELQPVFQRCLRIVFNAITRNSMVFEKNIEVLQALYDHRWEDIQLDEDVKENICFGGVLPKTLSRNNGRLHRTLECYRNFENGNFSDILALLLTVQLTIRCNVILHNRPDQQFISDRERELRFGNVKLLQIHEVANVDPLYELFQYPKSFDGGRRPFLHCVVAVDGKQYYPTLELAVAYCLFGERQHVMITEALYGFMVDGKMKAFMKPATEFVDYKESKFPKKWLKYKLFKRLVQAVE